MRVQTSKSAESLPARLRACRFSGLTRVATLAVFAAALFAAALLTGPAAYAATEAVVGPTADAEAAADVPKWLRKLRGESDDALSSEKTIEGLKEALRIGSDNAVNLTGVEDGYFKNEAIKILMPEKLRKLDKGLRKIGLDEQLDEFVLSMNRAAEQAAPLAKDILWGAVKEMSFDDAKQILKGGDTAATDYFRAKTTEELTSSFTPIVKDAMDGVGVAKHFDALVGTYERIPFAKAPELDLDEYVVNEALDGLFHMLGQEERKIRNDPAARVTSLLKEVFGSR